MIVDKLITDLKMWEHSSYYKDLLEIKAEQQELIDALVNIAKFHPSVKIAQAALDRVGVQK